MTNDPQQTTERELLLELLDSRHAPCWTVAELEAVLNEDPEVVRAPLLIRHALAELARRELVVLDGERVEASAPVRCLDGLNLIAV